MVRHEGFEQRAAEREVNGLHRTCSDSMTRLICSALMSTAPPTTASRTRLDSLRPAWSLRGLLELRLSGLPRPSFRGDLFRPCVLEGDSSVTTVTPPFTSAGRRATASEPALMVPLAVVLPLFALPLVVVAGRIATVGA